MILTNDNIEDLPFFSKSIIANGGDVSADSVLFLATDNGDMAYLTAPEILEDSPLTATAKQDIRVGTVAVTNDGIVIGEKNFPNCEITSGKIVIMPNMRLQIHLPENDLYEYTEIQVIICEFNSTLDDSVKAEMVCMGNNVYKVNTTEVLSTITKNDVEKVIDFGIINSKDVPMVIKYFTYKVVD